jgi:hypothetical protein
MIRRGIGIARPPASPAVSTAAASALLSESGDRILSESGSVLVLE